MRIRASVSSARKRLECSRSSSLSAALLSTRTGVNARLSEALSEARITQRKGGETLLFLSFFFSLDSNVALFLPVSLDSRIGSGDCLSTEHVPWRPAPERLRAVLQDPDNADLPKELQAERRRHESGVRCTGHGCPRIGRPCQQAR